MVQPITIIYNISLAGSFEVNVKRHLVSHNPSHETCGDLISVPMQSIRIRQFGLRYNRILNCLLNASSQLVFHWNSKRRIPNNNFMSPLPSFLFLLFTLLKRTSTGGYCYDTKCRDYDGSYIECDGQTSICKPGISQTSPATCSAGEAESESAFWCGDEEVCLQVEYTGKEYCATKPRSFLQKYYRYVLVGVVQVVCVGVLVGVAWSFWFKLGCFDGRYRLQHKCSDSYVSLLETNWTDA